MGKEKATMANAVKIDMEAFRRGVDDVMTLAPLRHALRSGANALFQGAGTSQGPKGGKAAVVSGRDNDGKHASRK